LLAIIAIEALLVAAHALLPDAKLVDLDLEFTLPAWFSALQLALVGIAALFAFECERRLGHERPRLHATWLLVAAGFLYLATDEMLALHERALTTAVRHALPADSLFQAVLPWQLVFAPGIVGAFVVIAALLYSRLAALPELRRLGLAGLALYSASFVFEGAAKPLFIPAGLYRLEVALEEASEMLGATCLLLAFAGYALARREGGVPTRPVSWGRVGAASIGLVLLSAVAIGLVTRANPVYLHRRAGDKFLEKKEYDEAIVAYRTAVGLEPGDADLWKRLGRAALRARRYDEASRAFGEAANLLPGSASVRNDLGVAIYHQGKLDAAETAYEAALAVRPDYWRAHKNLGVLHERRGDARAAEAAYRLALRAEEGRADVHRYLGNLLARSGRGAEAAPHWRRSLEIEPDQRHADELRKRLRQLDAGVR
jgi:tetratricopeptide (TPR) repeat protein